MQDDNAMTDAAREKFKVAQRTFDTLARQYNAAADAEEAAQRARSHAFKSLVDSFAELNACWRALIKHGPLPPLEVKEASKYLVLAKQRDRRELHAKLATCAPTSPQQN